MDKYKKDVLWEELYDTDIIGDSSRLNKLEPSHGNLGAKEISVRRSNYTIFNIGTTLPSTTSNTTSTWQPHLTCSKIPKVPSCSTLPRMQMGDGDPCPVIKIHGTLAAYYSESTTTMDNTNLHNYIDSLQHLAARVLQQFVMQLEEIQ